MLARQAGGSRRRLLTGTSAASFRTSIISSKKAKVNTVTARGRIQSNYRERPGQTRRGGGSPRRVQGLLPLLRVWGSRSDHSELGSRPRSRHQGPTQGLSRCHRSPGDRLLAAKFPFLGCVNSPQGRIPLKSAFQRSRPGPHRAWDWSAPRRRKPQPREFLQSCPLVRDRSGVRTASPVGVSVVVNLSASPARATIALWLHPWLLHPCSLAVWPTRSAPGHLGLE